MLNDESEISFNHVYFNQTRNPPDIGVTRIYDWGGGAKPQITCNDVIRNFERGICCGGKDILEWKIRSSGPALARN